MGKVTNPFAPVKKAGGEIEEQSADVAERAEYVEPEVVEDEKVDEVPDGVAKEVLNWVNNDKDRALRALETEEAKPNGGRVGLKRDLNDIIEN